MKLFKIELVFLLCFAVNFQSANSQDTISLNLNSALQYALKNNTNIVIAKNKVKEVFKDEFIYTWADMNSSLFSALKVERNVMFIILSLIILVAAFNIISGLTILVKNKTRDIAILKSIGVLNKSITKIFFLVGVTIGTTATIFGILLGVLVGNIFSVVLSTGFVIPWFWVITGIVICSGVGLAAGIYPAMKAASLNPINALRYE